MIPGKKSTEPLMTLPECPRCLAFRSTRYMAGGTEAKDRSGMGSAVTSATAARQSRNSLRRKPTVATRWVGKDRGVHRTPPA